MYPTGAPRERVSSGRDSSGELGACTSRQAAANQNACGDPVVVGCYAGSGAHLFASEKVILVRMANEVRGRRILDLGVGGGRTTPHLLELTADYLGVDYSPELIAACQAKFPGVRFEQGDARTLEILGEGTFDLVFFRSRASTTSATRSGSRSSRRCGTF